MLGPSKSIRYSGDFVTAGFVCIYFTVILPGFHMLFVIVGCHCTDIAYKTSILSLFSADIKPSKEVSLGYLFSNVFEASQMCL